jgi:predicted homoserine dehydrogenase-like protein
VINVGVIGYGYWGPNLVRNLFEVAETRVVAVSDMRQDRLDQVKSRYPSVEDRRNCDRDTGPYTLRARIAGIAEWQARHGRKADDVFL